MTDDEADEIDRKRGWRISPDKGATPTSAKAARVTDARKLIERLNERCNRRDWDPLCSEAADWIEASIAPDAEPVAPEVAAVLTAMRNSFEDPMWADHCELRKSTVKRWHDTLEREHGIYLAAVEHTKRLEAIVEANVQWTDAAPLPAKDAVGEAINAFTTAILHGDGDHREWLIEAAGCFLAGKPMPEPRGGGTASSPPKDAQPPYPEGDVVGPCVCGSWPGGPCLRCEWIEAKDAQAVAKEDGDA